MRALPIVATVLALAACTREDSVAPAPAWDLLDGFESDPLWSLESASDHADIACAPGTVSEGATALVVAARAGTRGKVVARKETDLDASALTGLSLDACVTAGPPPKLALGLRTADGGWFETAALQLVPGWNRGLAWTLDAFATGEAAAWAKGRVRVDRLMVLVVPQGGDCTVAVDALRGSGAWRWRSEPAELRDVAALPAAAQRFQPLELAFSVAWPPETRSAPAPAAGEAARMLRRMVAGGAWVTAPDGERWFQPAACTATAVVDGRPVNRYAVRLSPDRAGAWSVEAGLDAGAGRWQRGPATAVVVAPGAANPGPVRIDPADRQWLSRADGSFFWPLGMNIAWAGDYQPWLDQLAKDGGNAVRVWLCPWSNPLDVAGDLQTVNQDSAAAIDRLLDLALARGIAVQPCLAYHGWFGSDWAKNPFNAANGGPIKDGREFWTDGRARAGFRRVLDYAAARWGHHPALLAWELVNEADLAPRFRDEDVIEWHREMSAHLARVDRHRHPITTSVAIPARLAPLWRIADLDLVQVHRYERDPLRAVAAVAADVRVAGKPGWAAEASRDWLPGGDQADPEGRFLWRALWWSWIHGLAGSSWAWWWDTHILPNGLTRHHAAIARFLAGADPRGARATSVMAAGDGVAGGALVAGDRAWALADDPQAWDPAAPVPAQVPRRLRLAGLAPGAWTAERWDPVLGTVASTTPATVGDDGIIELSAPSLPAAWRLFRLRPLVPRLDLP